MDSLRRILLALLPLSAVLPVSAQSVHAFNWRIDNSVQSTFAECATVPIAIIPINGSLGSPPYYMVEYSPGSVTIPVPIGADPSSLSWQVRHPKGSQLLVSVIDSVGQSGGFPTQFFDVVAGDPTCQHPLPSNVPVITPNVSTSIHTCQPWGLDISGGIQPYTVSLAATASPVITNVTMGPGEDVFTFINRADPGTQLIAAVVDAAGNWGISTTAVTTTGSKDTTCPGLGSSSHTRAQIQSEIAAAAAAAEPQNNAKQQTAVALGIVFGLLVPLAIAAALGFWWWRRRKRILASRPPESYDDMQERADMPRPNLNINTDAFRVDSQIQRTRSWLVDGRQADSPTSVDMAAADIQPSSTTGPVPFLTSSHLPTPEPTPFTSPYEPQGAGAPNSTSPAATLSRAQRYRKQLEALAEAQAARERAGASGTPPTRSQSLTSSRAFPSQPVPRRAGSSARLPAGRREASIPERESEDGDGDSGGRDVVFQHRDGGTVEELPPPYRPVVTPGPPPGSPSPPPSMVAGAGD